MKAIADVYSAPSGHWVGDGFPVRSLFTYDRMGAANISPFLMLDYAGPYDFDPTTTPRGVGAHPHRGFETVTIVYDGEVAHRDSGGGGGVISTGDVQWMTAGNGIVHEEFHSPAFAERGGRFEAVQLWVNLRATDKSVPAKYQAIKETDISRVNLAEGVGTIAVIAGEYAGENGPARTFSPINVWDVRLTSGYATPIAVPEGHNTMLVILTGSVTVNETEVVREAEFARFSRQGTEIAIQANADAKILILTGEPFDEPVVGYGPFVMNSNTEIQESIRAFQDGRFGTTS